MIVQCTFCVYTRNFLSLLMFHKTYYKNIFCRQRSALIEFQLEFFSLPEPLEKIKFDYLYNKTENKKLEIFFR